jgi:hypothetical protein
MVDIPITFDIRAVPADTAREFTHELSVQRANVSSYVTSANLAGESPSAIAVKVFEYTPPVSTALLPAWNGHRGLMIFAALRVRQRRAAVVHELAHVYAPNQARFLAEGFAVYLEEKVGNINAYPTCGLSIEQRLNKVDHIGPSALGAVNLEVFDRVSVGNGKSLGDSVGLELQLPSSPHRAAYSYLVAGSFVKFLIETYSLNKFRALYETTPLTPGRCTTTYPGRYKSSVGSDLARLQDEWRTWLRAELQMPTAPTAA